MARPYCEKCLRGGYECLGYEEDQPRIKIRWNHLPASADIKTSEAPAPMVGGCRNDPAGTVTDRVAKPSILGTALLHRKISRVREIGSDLAEDIKTLHRSISASIDMTHLDKEAYLACVAGEYQGLRNPGTTLERYVALVDKFEQNFTTDLGRNLPPRDATDCFTARLELAILKFFLGDSIAGYTLLQVLRPKFLLLVATDSGLLVEQPNGNLAVSFPRTLSSLRHELARLISYDVILSFLLGAPPMIEYGYEGTCDGDGFEWIHGIPSALLQIISQINSWRAGSRVHLDCWQDLELCVFAWKPLQATLGESFVPGSTAFERAVVQEGWRHVVLIYIYMGICGVSSHDPRIQASVDVIFQLAEKMRNSRIGIHMLPHCVVAGIAARLEKQRIRVYEKLNSFLDPRAWLLRGPQFNRALYHLWHSTGAGGKAVTWDDYIRARDTVMPL
ncbi:hypothetical protein RHS01_05774 [Rhizoctonia solani]|uniref:Uncharacterized protein n=1 Tax=Rhizoctonia solani TaxID=456999 RepID=A0A8H7M4Q7_9AGAM|nr:hypothetical protein RHS01_05774 [Rhizoctonia solani]